MKIRTTYNYLYSNFKWDKVCDVLELDPYCLHNGMDLDDTVILTMEQADKLGFILDIK